MSNEKRLQQIRDAARYKYPDERIHFIDGAKWADSHPAWVSVEDELPPLHYEGANSTDFVLIYDGDDVLIAYYNFKEKKWYNEQYGALIIPATHWMPLPTKPVKKGGEQ